MVPPERPVLYSVDLTGCAARSALVPKAATAAFVGALERAGATVLRTCSTVFPGAGLTCVLILSESHAVLHTWPETGTVNIDIFSCSTRLKSQVAVAELGRLFGATGVSVQEIPVLTDMVRRPTDAGSFVLRGVAGSLSLFGLLRLHWTEAHVVWPLTRVQSVMAVTLLGAPTLPVEATLACSGADALALCLGAILAYPVRWRTRLSGAAGGAALILGVNTLRIGTLGRAVASSAWFNALHLYLWPSVLTLAIAGYVFAWMRLADRRQTRNEARDQRGVALHDVMLPVRLHPSRRFVVLTVAFLLLFVAASPRYLSSPVVAALAGFIARSTATVLGVVGVSAYAAANVLWTPRGAFLVTPECIATPLLPVYLAAVCAYAPTGRRWILGVVAMLPLFIALGIVRLLVVALPAVVASPIFFVHAFYQVLLGAILVWLAARWRYGGPSAMRHALLGLIAGVLFVQFLGPFYTRVIVAVAGAPRDDPQGAIAFLPGFQVGLYLALWVAAFLPTGWKRVLIGFAALEFTQAAGLLALHTVTTQSSWAAPVRDVRGWAVAGPLLILVTVVHVGRTRR